MTEVKSKTSQGSVLSGVNQKTSGTGFDIRSWQGLTAVLQAARSAEMDDTAYAAFRDMVLSYAQSGGDPALKSRIDAAIQSFSKPHEPKIKTEPVPEKQSMGTAHTTPSVTPAVTKSVVPQEETPRMRMGRPVPSFGLSASPRPATLTQVPQQVRVVTPIPAPVSTPTPVPVPMTSPVAQAEPVSESKPAPAPQVVPLKVESVPSVGNQSLDAYKARITEIKRIVHSTIGNPVTLIDAGNTIGRDYMNALLIAMKTVGGSGTGDAVEAMEKLEAAFAAVESLRPVTPEKEEVVTPVTPPPVVETPEPVEEVEVAKEVAVEQEVPPQHSEWKAEVMPTPEEAEVKVEVTPFTTPVMTPPVNNFPSSYEPEILPAKVGTDYVEYGAKLKLPDVNSVHTQHTAAPEVPMTPTEIQAAVARVQSPEAELESDEITSALLQLLHEWNIFASSGMFGTGPGGYDHPLYKTLAPLPMLTVANGGWDNAKTEERQSIRDYINAWRHEQAISYNPTESFEHYLRRVVQRVLKRQKGG